MKIQLYFVLAHVFLILIIKMASTPIKLIILAMTIIIQEVIPIQLQQGEELKENVVEGNQLNECIEVQRSTDVGYCFGKEVLNKLNTYDESDSFSLATGVTFMRDEKTPRDFGNFLDKDPMDFRAMMEDASNLISKRSLHWDLSGIYPGLIMRIGPTLANGVLEFVMDPRIKDRTYQQSHGEMSTGRLLSRNLLVPFLLGFKFQISTLLPLLLGLVLLASKKAFFLAKIALLAATLFSGGSNYGTGNYGNTNTFDFGSPSLSAYTSHDSLNHHHSHGPNSGGYFNRHPHHADYFYREKSAESSTASPITPDELRDRLERLFVTKKEIDEPRDDIVKVRNARHFAWTPINNG